MFIFKIVLLVAAILVAAVLIFAATKPDTFRIERSIAIKLRLDFIKPFEAQNTAEFTLTPDGDNTGVTWTMYGPMPYISKIMTTFFSMDRMVGGQFEEGLRNLKAIVEKPAGPTLPQPFNPA